MMGNSIIYRAARLRDGRFISQMIDISSDGIAGIDWQQQAAQASGVTALDVGSERYASEDGDYSFRNCPIAESDHPVGTVLAFPITDRNYFRDAKFIPRPPAAAVVSWRAQAYTRLEMPGEQGVNHGCPIPETRSAITYSQCYRDSRA